MIIFRYAWYKQDFNRFDSFPIVDSFPIRKSAESVKSFESMSWITAPQTLFGSSVIFSTDYHSTDPLIIIFSTDWGRQRPNKYFLFSISHLTKITKWINRLFDEYFRLANLRRKPWTKYRQQDIESEIDGHKTWKCEH